MKNMCIYLIAITTLSTYIYSNTMSAREKKEIATCSANFRFKYIIFENNKLLNCISDDSTEKIDKINVMNKLLNECPFSLSVDSIEVPSAVKDSISVFRFEFKSYNKELSDQLCFKYPADTIVIGVDNNGYSFFLHGFESNEFQAIFRMFFKRNLDMTNINEICYFYIRSVLGYSENHIITPQNFSEMKKKYQLFESQKRDFAMEIGPPQMPLTYTLPDDEKVFRCCFYTIERPFIFGIAINKRTFVFSHRGLQSENCELIDVTHVNIETK